MVVVDAIYGKNAGLVWRALNEKGQLGLRDLAKHTKLSMLEVNGAIGWLARENKIRIAEKETKTIYELAS